MVSACGIVAASLLSGNIAGIGQLISSSQIGIQGGVQLFYKIDKNAEKTGQALACAMILNLPPFAPGKTVNLIGFSLGGRVIDACI